MSNQAQWTKQDLQAAKQREDASAKWRTAYERQCEMDLWLERRYGDRIDPINGARIAFRLDPENRRYRVDLDPGSYILDLDEWEKAGAW